MKRPPIDLSGAVAENVPGGTLYTIDAETVYAKPTHGFGRTIRRLGKAHVATVRRNAENYLLRTAGLDTLPKCCCVCAVEVMDRNDHYCSTTCSNRSGAKRTAQRFDWDSLTEAEREAYLAPVQASYDERQARKGGYAGEGQKEGYPASYGGRDLHAGLALADALIAAKGGTVPLDTARATVADAHQRALARRTEALAETA